MLETLSPPPVSDHPRNDMWVDEQIWGHRLWDSTSPWLIFLEFLGVAEACEREGRLLDDAGVPYPLRYKPARRMYARNILYNGESLGRIATRGGNDTAAWDEWIATMNERAQGVPTRDFSYLRKRFSSFRDFASLITMLRSSTIESGSNKRWSSRFVFPFGRHALYEDLNLVKGNASREYINFGLPGELVYQMLCRSSAAEALRPHLAKAFDGDPCDRLLDLIEPKYEEDRQTRGNSYLPYARHQCFDDLGRDWLAVFELGLPRFDAYPHLATLAAFHLLRYQLVVASSACGRQAPTFVSEVVAPRKTLVRELSVASYQRNNTLPERSVEAYVSAIGSSPEWVAALKGEAPFTDCRRILVERVRWPASDDDYDGPHDPEMLLAEFRRAAVNRHRNHVANVHRSYGIGAGLVSKRGTTRLRYAPTDSILKALILANVSTRMDFMEFLALLYDRYGLVLGEREAERALDPDEFDKKAFQANSGRLERRLRTLGMLRRLSDACAYVENPLARIVR
ncbi:hypothetical protein [Mesorhizobium sp.]|uniref:hypothetical protein n=1 Tax=Mesorhizobium sp. TaxID=1871066 RepID=UPI000FE82F4C|nr:hypothetical protein [Mesorhizobium sp.]RWC13182.1 MAG: hypothetical protein EOS53_24640 [Mesorhizobium sp.]